MKNKRKITFLLSTVILLVLTLSSCILLKEKLTLRSVPSNVKVKIDNEQMAITPVTRDVSFGEHTLEVLTTYKTVGNYAGKNNAKYTFASWSDGSHENPRTVNIDSSKTYTFHMNTLYRLIVGANIPGASIYVSPETPDRFYSEGSSITLKAPIVQGYIFQTWLVNGTTETGSSLIQYMTIPIQATAMYIRDLPPNKPSVSYPLDGATDVSTNVTLRWFDTDPNGQSLTYDLYFGKSQTPQLLVRDINSFQYSLSNLNYSTTYYWYIVASDGKNTTQGNLWRFTTQAPPAPPAPANLHETSVATNSVSIAWNASHGASYYKIYRSTDNVNFSRIGQTTSTSYTDNGLSPSTTYYYKVTALNAYGESGFSNVISVTTSVQQENGTINGEVNVYTGKSAFISSAPQNFVSTNWQIQEHPKSSYIPNEVIVGFKRDVKITAAFAGPNAPFDYKVTSTLRTPDRSVNLALVKVSTDVEKAVKYFKSLPNVEYVEPNYISYALSTPNDQYYSKQWNLPDIDVPQAWQITKGGNTVIVAVLDTGVSLTHPDLKDVLVNGYNFVSNNTVPMDDYGHGTHVAGIIAAETNNSIGVAGVDWGGTFSTKIMPVKVLGSDGVGSDYQVAEGIVYATQHGAKVINMSLGGSNFSTTEEKACQYAYDNGVVLVASAGNSNANSLDYPAAFSTVIPVSAVGPDNTRAYYSNYASNVIYAPGGEMHSYGDPNGIISTYYATSTTPHNTYAYLQGTSMAAPHISAVAALMISNGITDPANIWNILKNTSTYIGPSSEYGYGLVNSYNAVTYNGRWEPMIVWAENSNDNLVAESTVTNSGDFSMTLPVGTYKIYAWQDFNGDGVIDPGDFYGFYGYHGYSSDSPISVNVSATSSLNLDILVSPKIDNSNYPLGISDLSQIRKYVKNAISKHYNLIH